MLFTEGLARYRQVRFDVSAYLFFRSSKGHTEAMLSKKVDTVRKPAAIVEN
jgi:hypothetical protein